MFKKTSAFIRGSWDGVPDESNFTQDETVFASTDEFKSYVDQDILDLIEEITNSGDLLAAQIDLSADGKVMLATKEFVDEAAWSSMKDDPRWATENAVTKLYSVEAAPSAELVNTFNEPERIYYHTVDHLF